MNANLPSAVRRVRRRAARQRIRHALHAASLAVISSASWLPHKIVRGAKYFGILLTLWESAEAAFGSEEEDHGAD